MKYDLSIVVPGIRKNNWGRLFHTALESSNPHNIEMIFISPEEELPNELKDRDDVKFFRDFGSPSRCFMIGSMLAEGKYITIASDDGFYLPSALSQCINLFEENKISKKDGICVRYSEGPNFAGQIPPDDYWTARTHADQQLIGVKNNFRCAPVFMYRLDFFREIGGLDCRWDHCNMNTHDLSFRVQNNGGTIHLSPSLVLKCDWSWNWDESKPIQRAYKENDAPLFKEVWNQDQSNRIKINYFNWMDAESRWKRRFK